MVASSPCPERCPICKQKCTGGLGHSFIRTAGRKVIADLHACRDHVWGSLAEQCEQSRAQSRQNRLEILEAGVNKCSRCRRIVEQLGVGV
jgi:hydroxymethylpyrimidine pyrophosphatase-like HAD family hydrolase